MASCLQTKAGWRDKAHAELSRLENSGKVDTVILRLLALIRPILFMTATRGLMMPPDCKK